jgi:hypothetical protein
MTHQRINSSGQGTSTDTWSPPSEPMVPRLAAPSGPVGSVTSGPIPGAPRVEADSAAPPEPVSRLSPTGWSPTAWRVGGGDA